MQREEPGENAQAEGGWNEQPGGLALPKPKVGKVAADDLGQGGHHEQASGNEQVHPAILAAAKAKQERRIPNKHGLKSL